MDIGQGELAAATGTSQAHISRIEQGHGNPTLDTLLDIEQALNFELLNIPRENGRSPMRLRGRFSSQKGVSKNDDCSDV